jgi:pimeloyl-ACP methyl ester carboxylesterase
MKKETIIYRKANVNGINIFYRQAGAADAPVVLLLHGYTSSSHLFRNLIPVLSEQYQVIAPDMPGFGYSDTPDHQSFKYTFDNLALYIQGFINRLGLKRFALYVFDFGAPVGFRIAMANAEKITGIITQNGNVYKEGITDGWKPMQQYWAEPTLENRNALRGMTEAGAIKWQYVTGVDDETAIAPESYTLDQYFTTKEGKTEILLDLFKDYANNVALYPIIHKYLRAHQPPLLAAWGNRDPFLYTAGAEAFKKDNPNAIVKFFNTGHFALETHGMEIGVEMLNFLAKVPR